MSKKFLEFIFTYPYQVSKTSNYKWNISPVIKNLPLKCCTLNFYDDKPFKQQRNVVGLTNDIIFHLNITKLQSINPESGA